MARTHGRIKVEVWDAGSELRGRTLHAQWAYFMLISQPQINNCGVLPFVPRKWAKYAAGLSAGDLLSALGELEEHGFVVVDEGSDELLVRTFIKHDRIEAQPNLVTSAQRQYREIESDRIREALSTSHPHLFGEYKHRSQLEMAVSETPSETPSESPSRTPSGTPPRPRARTRTAPAPSPTTAPSPAEEGSFVGSTPPREPEFESNGLPLETELEKAQLLSAIGKDADEKTAKVLEGFGMPPAAWIAARCELERLRGRVDNRAAYTVGLFRSWRADRRYSTKGVS